MLRTLAAKVLETLILEERASCIVVELVVLIIDAAYDVLRLRMRLFAHLPIKKVRRWGRVGRLVRNAFYNPVVIVVVVIVVIVDMATPPDDSSIIASTGHRRPGPSRGGKREGFQTPYADMQTMQAAVQSG